MEQIRSSIPTALKSIIEDLVRDKDSPFRSESELVRLAVGSFVTEFIDMHGDHLKYTDQNTWEDILHAIIKKGIFGMSTRELKDRFPRMEKVIYYHLTSMKKRGLIEYMGVSSGIVRLRKKVALKSGFWRSTTVGYRFENVKGWKHD